MAKDKTVNNIGKNEVLGTRVGKKRIWEVDFLRGLLIIAVMFDHFVSSILRQADLYTTEFWKNMYNFAVAYFSRQNTYGIIRSFIQYPCVMAFVLVSGVSSSFSRNNFVRGLKLALVACLETAVTYLVDKILPGNVLITFNILHVLACCILIWSVIELFYNLAKRNWQKNIVYFVSFVVIIASLIIGYYFKNNYSDTDKYWMFIYSVNHKSPSDYVALLPALGWFITGVFLGKGLYRQKQTLLPTVNPKWLCAITFIGRNTLWFYLGSQALYSTVFYIFTTVFPLM